MPAAGVVEAIDVVKEGKCYLIASCPSVPPDEFGLRGFEQGFDGGVFIAVALFTYVLTYNCLFPSGEGNLRQNCENAPNNDPSPNQFNLLILFEKIKIWGVAFCI